MEGFKAPQTIPQDLLLIQEFIDIPPTHNVENSFLKEVDVDISSSSSECDHEEASEEEIAADLTKGAATDDEEIMTRGKSLEPSDSSSDSESSESDDERENESRGPQLAHCEDDDEDLVPAPSSGSYFTTKNEITDVGITSPGIDEVGPEEQLEKVGEIMNIVDRVVIVRGLPSDYVKHASERALDSDTLLVLEDRKILGYIYETFGPTTQPLYQVKFNNAFPLDPERARIGREVFHVPSRSKFVFVSQIKALRGSDASNVHDEEPADDEVEFSDDEAEAAYRSRLKRRRGESRNRSVVSSRSTTPNPAFMRDEDLTAADEAFISGNAYDEHGPYDIDYSSVPGPLSSSSRPSPITYDDPYADSYTSPDIAEREAEREASSEPRVHSHPSRGRPERGRGRGRGYGGRQSGRGGNRGRERTTKKYGEGQMSSTNLGILGIPQFASYPILHQDQEYSPLYPEPHIPQQMPMQYSYGGMPHPQAATAFVQPHINPRFASAFGLAVYPPRPTQGYAAMQQQPYDTWMDESPSDPRQEAEH